MKIPVFLGILCMASSSLVSNIQAETLTYQDGFIRKEAESGTPLDSEKVGKSNLVWEATSNVVLAGESGLQVTDQGAFVGRVTLPKDFKVVTVEADVYPAVPGDQDSVKPWIGVGIGNAKLGIPNFGGLVLALRPEGVFSLLFNPSSNDAASSQSIALTNGHIKSWNPNGMNHLKLVYNKENNTVSAFANEDEVLVDELSLTEQNLTLVSEFAGFSGFGQSSEVKSIGGFHLSVSQ